MVFITREGKMEKWRCKVCGYIYNPEKGNPDGNIPPNTPFDTLPDTWVCLVYSDPKIILKGFRKFQRAQS